MSFLASVVKIAGLVPTTFSVEVKGVLGVGSSVFVEFTGSERLLACGCGATGSGFAHPLDTAP